jgi:hypothetical protein
MRNAKDMKHGLLLLCNTLYLRTFVYSFQHLWITLLPTALKQTHKLTQITRVEKYIVDCDSLFALHVILKTT